MANNNLKAYLNIMSNGESDRLNNVNNNAYNDYSLTESLAISRYNALNRKRNLSTNALINLNNYNNQLEKQKESDRNGWQRFWDTISEGFTNVWNGLFSGIDSIGDFFITVGSWFTDDDTWATNAKNYDWVSQATNTMSQFSELGVSLMTGDMFSEDYWNSWETIGSAKESQEELNELYNNSLLAELPNDTHDWINGVFSSLGQMMPSIGLSFIPGVGQAASLGYMGLSSGGRVVSDTYDETGSVWKSLLKGVGVGATEVASELVVGGVLEKLGLGTGKIGGIIGKAGSATRQGFVSELAKTMFEEGTEEVFSGLMQPVWDSITEGTSVYKQYFTKEFWVGGNDSILSQFVAGAVAGGIMGGASIAENYARYGKNGYHLLQNLNDLNETYNNLKKYSQTDSRYATELNKIADLSASIVEQLDNLKAEASNGGKFQTHFENVLSAITGSKVTIDTDTAFNSIVEDFNTNGNPNTFVARNLVSELNKETNKNVKVVFSSNFNNNEKARFNSDTQTIEINDAYSSEFAPLIAHEFIGHAVLNNISSENRFKLIKDIENTNYYKENANRIRETYGDNQFDEELIANYIQNEMTDLKSVSDTFLNKSILRKALNLFTNKFIKTTDKAILNEIVGLVRKVSSVNTILEKLINRIPLNKKERKFFANHEAFFNYARNAVNQVSYSKTIDNVNNQEVNYTYERTNEFRELQEESRARTSKSNRYESFKEFNETIRTRLSNVLKEQIQSSVNSDSNVDGLLENTNNFKIYKNINGQLFHDIFEIVRPFAKNGELVDLHENYDNATCYIADDGLSGFAITNTGDLVSVFNASDKRGFLRSIANEVKANAKTLDCYSSPNQLLNKMYSDIFGFKTASIMDYNMEYDHDNIAKNHSEPQVAFMVNTSEEVETRHFNKDQYDEAQEYQLSYVNKQNANSVDLSKVKIGSNGKIVRDNITEPLFEIANDSIKIAKENFNFIKKNYLLILQLNIIYH